MSEVCGKAGLPLEPEKDEGPATTLVAVHLRLQRTVLGQTAIQTVKLRQHTHLCSTSPPREVYPVGILGYFYILV